ncbi:MAG: sigma-70 family RNA polymerase sigma factor [Planctomycetota bacterium]
MSPHLPAMVRAARSILGSEDLAWDAVQETLLRAWVRGSLPGEARSVLVHLAIKSSLHLLRCQRRRNDHESQAGEGAPVCCDEHPLAALDHAETARVVRDAVAGLTQEYRAVVELFEFQGESYEAIAARLSLPIGTVRSRLSRGRRLLRDRLLAHYRAA